MSNLQWNIFFMGIDSTDLISNEKNIIKESIEKFKEDVLLQPYNKHIKINLLKFIGKKGVDNSEEFLLTEDDKKNKFTPVKPIEKFDCLSVGSYETILKNWLAPTINEKNQKYMFIFLAHSFGGGFFTITNPKASGGVQYFTTIQLNEAIVKAFVRPGNPPGTPPEKIMVDCFFAVNCGLQSIETNLVFCNSVRYLIGSQQPLAPVTISYRELLQTMALEVYLGDEIIFVKFLYDSYRNYKAWVQTEVLKKPKKQQDKSSFFSLDEFSLSITEPANAINLKEKLNGFAQAIKLKPVDKFLNNPNKHIEQMVTVATTCKDPSGLGLVNVIDAYQFYASLQASYYMGQIEADKVIYKALSSILEAIRSVIVLNLNSGNLCKTEPLQGDLTGLYLPMGLGHIMPKNKSDDINKLLKIFGTIYYTSKNGVPIEPSFGRIPGLVEEITSVPNNSQ